MILRLSALLVYMIFFIVTGFDESYLKARVSRTLAAVCVLVAQLVAEHGGALFVLAGDTQTYPVQSIRPTFYLIVASHVLLPFPSRVQASIATLIIIVIELLLTYHSRSHFDCSPKVRLTSSFNNSLISVIKVT